MREHRKNIRHTFLSISRQIRFAEIDQQLLEKTRTEHSEWSARFLYLAKHINSSGRVFTEEGC